MALVYGLFDPRTSELRYVGYTNKSLAQRLNAHLRDRFKGATHKNHWIQSLLDAGVKPEIDVIEEIVDGRAYESEMFWIGYFRSIGAALTNGTMGGGGLLGHVPSETSRIARSEKMKGRTPAPQTIEANRVRMTGTSPSPQTRARLRSANLGRKASAETGGAKLSAMRRGRKHSPEHAANLTASIRRYWANRKGVS